jgi:hypothetical protein
MTRFAYGFALTLALSAAPAFADHRPGHCYVERHSYGYCYHGYGHNHWSSSCWNDRYRCRTYHCERTRCDYYWCRRDCCYYPVSHCPYGRYDY